MNHPPTGPLSMLGDSIPGETLVARPNGIEDADGMGPGSFQWTRDGEPIAGEVTQFYTVRDEDQGCEIAVRYTFTDGVGTVETVETDAGSVRRIPDAVSDAIAALYFLIFDREPDALGLRFYVGLYRNGVKLSFLVADMERNKAAGAK